MIHFDVKERMKWRGGIEVTKVNLQQDREKFVQMKQFRIFDNLEYKSENRVKQGHLKE